MNNPSFHLWYPKISSLSLACSFRMDHIINEIKGNDFIGLACRSKNTSSYFLYFCFIRFCSDVQSWMKYFICIDILVKFLSIFFFSLLGCYGMTFLCWFPIFSRESTPLLKGWFPQWCSVNIIFLVTLRYTMEQDYSWIEFHLKARTRYTTPQHRVNRPSRIYWYPGWMVFVLLLAFYDDDRAKYGYACEGLNPWKPED